MDNEQLICIKKKIGEVHEIECEGNEPLICIFSTEGKSLGGSLLGAGAQGGEHHPVIKCFSETDFKQEIAKNHGVNPEKIIIKEEE